MRRKIGIVMSGGSSKGAYQIGFFKALIKSGLYPCVETISATSIGAINAYAFLTGKLEQAERIWLSIDVNGIWKFRSKIKKEDLLAKNFSQIIGRTDYVPCDFHVTLSEMSTMTARHFNLKGGMTPIHKALLETSISIPLLTTSPLQYEGKLYFDGGVTENIPYTPIAGRQQDILFIVHFTPGYRIEAEALDKAAKVIYVDMSRSRNFIKGNFNFRHEQVKQMIEEGERYTLQLIDEFVRHRGKSRQEQTAHGLYYYLSGARLLSILNRLLKIGKDKRQVCLARIKKFRGR